MTKLFNQDDADDAVTNWDIRAHRLQTFHQYGNDPSDVLYAMADWLLDNPEKLRNFVNADVRVWHDETEGSSIEGTIEYVGEPPRIDRLRGSSRTITDVLKDCWQVAEDHGWHEDIDDRTFVEKLALVHSEVSEALEEYRDGHLIDETYFDGTKPEGVPIELADAVIRIFDLAGIYGIDIDAAISTKQDFNRTRPFRHGGKAC